MSPRRVALGLLVFAIAFSPRIPLAIDVPGRRFDLRVEDLLLAGFAGIWLLRLMQTPKLTVTPLARPIGAYVLVMILSTVVGIGTLEVPLLRASLYLFKDVEYLFLFLLAANWVKSERDLRFVIGSLLLASSLNLGWVAVQYMVGLYRPLVLFASPGGVYEPRTLLESYGPGLIGEVSPLSAGGFFMITGLLGANALMFRQSAWSRLWLQTLAITLPAAMLLTQSRAAILAWFVALTALMVSRKNFRYFLYGFVVLALALIAGSLGGQGDRLIMWVSYPRSLGFRLHSVWIPLWEHVLGRFLVGFGKGALGYLPAVASEEAHNQYLRVVIESGIIGLVVFLWLLVRILTLAWETGQRKGTGAGRVLGLTVFAITAGLAIAGIVQDVFVPVVVNEIWWLLVGLTMAARGVDFRLHAA